MSESDQSDYYSDSDSESEISENVIKDKVEPNKLVIGQNNIKAFDEEDDDDDDEEKAEDDDADDADDVDVVDDVDDVDFLEQEDSQTGGADESGSDTDDDVKDDDNVVDNKKASAKKNKANIKPTNASNLIIDDDDDDDEDEYDDSYLQKFDSEITKNYINEYHPECMIHNYDEIAKLAMVIRDSTNIIIDPLHKTIPYLTKYERARILGQRAKQIETGARPLVKVPETIVDSYVIAELELQQKRIPFIIRRPIPDGGCEYWNLKDLEMILF
jgi:DNA-directed RNA polymerase I, II, and III subunit RPABC2